MSKLNGKAPAVHADALFDTIEDALLGGSIDAAAALDKLTARGKPVYRKTKIRLRNARRHVVLFDNALDAVVELRKAAEARQAMPAAPPRPAQMALPLPASNGANGAAHVS